MVIANHNADVAEYREFALEGLFPVDRSEEAYKLGINYMVYGLTHQLPSRSGREAGGWV
jgi:hypothetical protein